MLRAGFACRKICSNGKRHDTCVKLIDEGEDMKVCEEYE